LLRAVRHGRLSNRCTLIKSRPHFRCAAPMSPVAPPGPIPVWPANDRNGAGRAVPSANPEWPKRVEAEIQNTARRRSSDYRWSSAGRRPVSRCDGAPALAPRAWPDRSERRARSRFASLPISSNASAIFLPSNGAHDANTGSAYQKTNNRSCAGWHGE
jgi:hypothetical protein